MKKTLFGLIILLLIGGAYYIYNSGLDEGVVYASDTTLPGDTVINSGERITLKDGATLTVEGNLNINGDLECDNGPLNLVVLGSVSAGGQITCQGEGGLNIIAQNNIT